MDAGCREYLALHDFDIHDFPMRGLAAERRLAFDQMRMEHDVVGVFAKAIGKRNCLHVIFFLSESGVRNRNGGRRNAEIRRPHRRNRDDRRNLFSWGVVYHSVDSSLSPIDHILVWLGGCVLPVVFLAKIQRDIFGGVVRRVAFDVSDVA